MKKTVLTLGSAFMLFAMNLKAQEQPLSFGLKAGASNSWVMGLSGKSFGSNKGKASMFNVFPTGGAHVGYAFHEYMGVGFEVNYVRTGAVTTEKTASGTQTGTNNNKQAYSIHSHKLSMPIAFRIFPMGYDPEEGVLSINLGPQVSFALSTEVKSGTTANNGPVKDPDFRKEYANSFNVGAFAGVSYEFPATGISIEGRYHFFGFMNALKDDTGARSYKSNRGLENKSLRDQLATLTLGYDFASLMS